MPVLANAAAEHRTLVMLVISELEPGKAVAMAAAWAAVQPPVGVDICDEVRGEHVKQGGACLRGNTIVAATRFGRTLM